MSKANQCDECKHVYVEFTFVKTIVPQFKCTKGHKPKFYKPKSYTDDNYGWKRVCSDYQKEIMKV